MSILAHMILMLKHPFTFENGGGSGGAGGSTATGRAAAAFPRWMQRNLVWRPLAVLSAHVAPASGVYRGLTPQFKVFLQLAAMTLGGCVWAERRVAEYTAATRARRRAEQREQAVRPE
jgi:hypothetical protein